MQVVVGANMGVSKMTKEHIGIAVALGLPLFIVVTKMDLAPPEVAKHTLEAINKVLKQVKRALCCMHGRMMAPGSREALIAQPLTHCTTVPLTLLTMIAGSQDAFCGAHSATSVHGCQRDLD